MGAPVLADLRRVTGLAPHHEDLRDGRSSLRPDEFNSAHRSDRSVAQRLPRAKSRGDVVEGRCRYDRVSGARELSSHGRMDRSARPREILKPWLVEKTLARLAEAED